MKNPVLMDKQTDRRTDGVKRYTLAPIRLDIKW